LPDERRARAGPDVREPEERFGDFPKCYSAREARKVIEIDIVTHDRDPIYLIIPAGMEHLPLVAVMREPIILAHQQRTFAEVVDAHIALGGVCPHLLYVKLKKNHEGGPTNVIIGSASFFHHDIKQVFVDDDDVHVHNPTEVEWAAATRFRTDRDLVVVSGGQGSVLNPSTTLNCRPDDKYQGVSAKMALDVIKPLVYDERVFTRVNIPGEDEVDLEREVDSSARPDWAKILAE
jgi:2,5-furandicarboxylate decarboxylase 1